MELFSGVYFIGHSAIKVRATITHKISETDSSFHVK